MNFPSQRVPFHCTLCPDPALYWRWSCWVPTAGQGQSLPSDCHDACFHGVVLVPDDLTLTQLPLLPQPLCADKRASDSAYIIGFFKELLPLLLGPCVASGRVVPSFNSDQGGHPRHALPSLSAKEAQQTLYSHCNTFTPHRAGAWLGTWAGDALLWLMAQHALFLADTPARVGVT